MGRKPIPLDRPVADIKVRPTFSKRKEGLQKKARQLGAMCGCRVALIIFPPEGGNDDRMFEVATHGTIKEIFQMYLRRKQGKPVTNFKNQSPSEAIMNGIGGPHIYPASTSQVQQLRLGVPHVYPASQSQAQQLGVSHISQQHHFEVPESSHAGQSRAQQLGVSHISQQQHFEVPESSHAGQSRAQQLDIGAMDNLQSLEAALADAIPNQPRQSGVGVTSAFDMMHQSDTMQRMWGYHQQNLSPHCMHQNGNHMPTQSLNQVGMEHAQMHPHLEGHHQRPLIAQPGDERQVAAPQSLIARRRRRAPIPYPVARPGASSAAGCHPHPGPNMRHGSA